MDLVCSAYCSRCYGAFSFCLFPMRLWYARHVFPETDWLYAFSFSYDVMFLPLSSNSYPGVSPIFSLLYFFPRVLEFSAIIACNLLTLVFVASAYAFFHMVMRYVPLYSSSYRSSRFEPLSPSLLVDGCLLCSIFSVNGSDGLFNIRKIQVHNAWTIKVKLTQVLSACTYYL